MIIVFIVIIIIITMIIIVIITITGAPLPKNELTIIIFILGGLPPP